MSGELIAPTPQHCPGTESEDAGKSSGKLLGWQADTFLWFA